MPRQFPSRITAHDSFGRSLTAKCAVAASVGLARNSWRGIQLHPIGLVALFLIEVPWT